MILLNCMMKMGEFFIVTDKKLCTSLGVNIQKYIYNVLELLKLSSVLKNTTFQKLDRFPSSGERVEGIYSVGPLRES
jgi:hypothetical protein